MKRTSLAVLLALVGQGAVNAYEMPNHYDFAITAVENSVLTTDPTKLHSMGLKDLLQRLPSGEGEDPAEFTDSCEHGRTFPITLLIACGAQFEDHPGTRAFNHFYDPTNDQPLTVEYGGAMIKPGDHYLVNEPNLPSPDWALQDNNGEPKQASSYADAREYFWQALTSATSERGRQESWGALFQTLGQVIHHVQDMAQPQHVRNDQHLDKWWIRPYYNPSWYEKYTRDQRMQLKPLLGASGSGPVFTPGGSSAFMRPRDFWKNTNGSGIAQFTNANFVSPGTNFEVSEGQQVTVTKYVSPPPRNEYRIPVEEIDPPVSPYIREYCYERALTCTMTFYSSEKDIFVERAASQSIFDEHIQLRPVRYYGEGGSPEYHVDRIFTLNHYNFEAAYPALLPRAVGYSAGLVNFFFRGKLEISLPDSGLFGIVDHAVENDKDVEGFHWIDVNVQNVTQRGTAVEPVETGPSTAGRKLVAVVKYHRNDCYQPSLAGEYGAPNVSWHVCRNSTEEIAVSLATDVPEGINSSPQTVRFNFLTPIPINASDVYLQVVYRGPLGEEPDAVIVATRDISEPIYVGHFDTQEQYYYGAGPQPWTHTFKEWFCDRENPGLSYEECKDKYSMTCYAQYSSSELTLIPPAELNESNATITSTVPVSRFARVAILTEPDAAWGSRRCIHNIDGRSDFHASGRLVPYPANQLDPSTGVFTSRTYREARGVFVTEVDSTYEALTAGNVQNPPLLNPAPVFSAVPPP